MTEDEARRQARRISFDRHPEQYDAVRPTYPSALVDAVIARAPGPRVLEVGAGTGKATVVLARAGLAITALEPGREMARVLRRNVADFPAVTVHESTFEAFTGTGFDLVLAAQAWHWTDEATRYAQAAAAGRMLAVLTNEKMPFPADLEAELDAAYARWLPSAYHRGADPIAGTRAQWVGEIERSGLFGPVEVLTEPWRETYTSQRYIDLLTTYSDHAVHPDPRPLYDAIRAAIDRRGGAVEIAYVTMAFVARVQAGK